MAKKGKPIERAAKPPRKIPEAENKRSSSVKYRFGQLSAMAKIILFSGGIYLILYTGFLFFREFFDFTLPESFLGLPINLAKWLIQITLFAVILTIMTKLFFINPVNRIKKVINEALKGDPFARIEFDSQDEIGELARMCNQVLEKHTDTNYERMKTEYDLLMAQDEIRKKSRIEKKKDKLKQSNKELESMVNDFSLLYEIGQLVNSTIDIDQLYSLLQDVIPKRLGLQKFAILISDERKEFLNIKAASGFENNENISDISFLIGQGASGEAASTGEVVNVPDIKKEDRFLYYRGERQNKGSFVSIPLKYQKDILGVMNCSRSKRKAFSKEDITILTLVANQIAMAVENAKLYSKTRELAVRDELTGLYNRRHFQEVLQMEWKRTTRFKRPLSILMIDIDHFKAFNDTFGHIHGDKVLHNIANLISRNLREVDTIARFGGEEFIVLLPDTDKTGASIVAEKLRSMSEEERFVNDRKEIMPITISVGVSNYPIDARDMDDLIDHADIALYDAKDSGRNRVVVYNSDRKSSVVHLHRPPASPS